VRLMQFLDFQNLGIQLRPLMPSSRSIARQSFLPPPVWRCLAVARAVNPTADPAEIQARLETLPGVVWVEPDRTIRIFSATEEGRIPNDAEFFQQWNLHNTGEQGGTPDADIDAPEAWARTVGSDRIIVAVIDTGIDYFHPDLASNIWTNAREIPGNAVDDDQDGYIDDWLGFDFVSHDPDPIDDHGHGTHVAGIIGAVSDNGRGIAGVAWKVRLMALKAFNEEGEADVADVVEAIGYAVEHGAQVLNASWGTIDQSVALSEAVRDAARAGVLVVCAAGNLRSQRPLYPAALEETMAVAATTAWDKRALFSSYGDWVDIAAPGQSILSLWLNAHYLVLSGTSMAVPHVSGAAVLLWSVHPEFTAEQVRNALVQTADDLNLRIRGGRLNVARAVAVVQPLPEVRLDLPEVWSGVVSVRGRISGAHVTAWRLEARPEGEETWTRIGEGNEAVSSGILVSRLDTTRFPDGPLQLQLVVQDDLGQIAWAKGRVWIQNLRLVSPAIGDVLVFGKKVRIRGTTFGKPGRVQVDWSDQWRPTRWSQEGIEPPSDPQTYPDGSRDLAVWDTSRLQPNHFYSLRLSLWDGDRLIGAVTNRLIYLTDQTRLGWPIHLPAQEDFPTNDWREMTVADLDQDGQQEILVVEPGSPSGRPTILHVLEPDGKELWQRPIGTGLPYSDVPAVGDLDGDGRLEVVTGADEQGRLFAFHCDGAPVAGWPVQVEGIEIGKLIADVDGDGRNEVVACATRRRPGGPVMRELAVFRGDGTKVISWALNVRGDIEIEQPMLFPVVGNLDEDPKLEIVAVSSRQSISAYDLDHPEGPIWTHSFPALVAFSPVIGDLDDDGQCEVVVGLYDDSQQRPSRNGGLYVLNADGSVRDGWPVLTGESFVGEAALVDLNRDGRLEIIAPSWRSGRIHVLRADGMEELGWPTVRDGMRALRSPVTVARWDGVTRVISVLMGNGWVYWQSGFDEAIGGVVAWDRKGNRLDLNPEASFDALVMESVVGGAAGKTGAPVLCDLDEDGELDIVVATVFDYGITLRDGVDWEPKDRFSVYSWELPAKIQPGDLLWPMFRGGPERTGYRPPRPRLPHPPDILEIPNQTVASGTPFYPIDLKQYVVDLDDPIDQLRWQVQVLQGAVEATIDTNQVLHVYPLSPDWEGDALVQLTVWDPTDLHDVQNVWFRARKGYHVPITQPDFAQISEDTPIEITVLTNDHPVMGAGLKLVTVGRPLHGIAQIHPQTQTIFYLPATNYFGSDSFEYTVQDDLGGTAFGKVQIVVTPVPDPPQCNPDWVQTDEDTPVRIYPLQNDTDPDGDPIRLGKVFPPQHGTIQVEPDGSILYTPNPDWNGTDSITYRAIDSTGQAGQSIISIRVRPVNDPPRVHDQQITLNRNTSVTINFAASDPDGDRLTFQVVQNPQHGELWMYPDVATYFPKHGFVGQDQFVYRASDGKVQSPEATVTLIVEDRNNPPIAQSQQLTIRTNHTIQIQLQADDPDEEPLTFELVQPPQHGSAKLDGDLCTYQPDHDFVGLDQFQFRARDPWEPGPPATVQITVTTNNTAPKAWCLTLHVTTGQTKEFDLPVKDGEWDPLTIEILQPPHHGKLTLHGKQAQYTPEPNFLGPDRFTFRAFDGDLWSRKGTVSILVEPDNHPPIATNLVLQVHPGTTVPVHFPIQDEDGDPLHVVILRGPKKGFVTGIGTNFVFLAGSQVRGTDSFTYKVWDGYAYSKKATVTIQFETTPPPPLRIEAIKYTEEGIKLRVSVQPGRRYVLEATTDWQHWEPLQTFTATDSSMILTDPDPLPPYRFYRLRSLDLSPGR